MAASVFFPRPRAFRALVKPCHGFVPSSDLHHEEIGSPIPTLSALCISLIRICPGFLASKDVVDLFLGQVHFPLHLLLEVEDVGARLAEEAEVLAGLVSEEQVPTGWAEKHLIIKRQQY